MYKFYSKNGQAQFYEHGVEIDGTVYGIHADRDILRIKRRIAKIKHTDITFEQPTAEQLSQIQLKTFDSMSDMKQYVQSVMNGDETMSQDEINAMLLLKIAEMEVAITNEQTTN